MRSPKGGKTKDGRRRFVWARVKYKMKETFIEVPDPWHGVKRVKKYIITCPRCKGGFECLPVHLKRGGVPCPHCGTFHANDGKTGKPPLKGME